MKHELRLQLDAPGPDWNRRIQAGVVIAIDLGVATAAGLAAMFAGGHFWVAAAVVLVLCYAVAVFRAASPRSAFMLPKNTPKAPVVAPTEPEPFAEDALEANSV